MTENNTIVTAATPALGITRARKAVVARLTAPAAGTVDRTGLSTGLVGGNGPVVRSGLPSVGGLHLGAVAASGVAMPADQAQKDAFDRTPVVDRWIPPRRTPVRC